MEKLKEGEVCYHAFSKEVVVLNHTTCSRRSLFLSL